MKKLKNEKTAGLDVPPEAWKSEEFNDILLDSCNAVYDENPINKWTEGCILPFPKKGESNTITEAQSLFHSLETASGDIGLYVNAGKTKFISYNQTGSIKTLNSKALKSVNSFTYLGSNIASTETDVKTQISKAWSAPDGFNAVWKPSLPNNIKRDFFQAAVETVLVYGSSSLTLTKKLEAT